MVFKLLTDGYESDMLPTASGHPSFSVENSVKQRMCTFVFLMPDC